MNRNIIGIIRKAGGTVWAGGEIVFELEHSSYDEEAQYPVSPVRVFTNTLGQINATLWINEAAPHPTRYICTLPDQSQFRFALPPGAFPVNIRDLRANAVEDDSPYQNSLAAFLPVMRQEIDQRTGEIDAQLEGKADQLALTAAIASLQNAITQAQSTLQGLIDQKAELGHSHSATDVFSNTPDSVAVFNGEGEMAGSGELSFYQNNLGIGTATAEYPLDVRRPGFESGYEIRAAADLSAGNAALILQADQSANGNAAIRLNPAGGTVDIQADPDGLLNIGSDTFTTAICLKTLYGPCKFVGFIVAEGEPTTDYFPEPGMFGLYADRTTTTLYMAANDDGRVKVLTFGKVGGLLL